MAEGRPPVPARSWSRIDGVDCLRALAILYVLLNHIGLQLIFAGVHFRERLPCLLITDLIWQGQRGVQIFFAVSGFLITSTSLRRWGSLNRISIRDFYAIRFARIGPLFLVLLIILSVLHLAGVPHFVVPSRVGGLGSALLAALTLRVGLFEARHGYFPGSWDILWSLSVEEMFYLFFPIAGRILGRGKLLITILLGFVVLGPLGRTVFSHGNEVWREYSYLGSMDAIALGCLTALTVSGRSMSRRAKRILAGCGAGLLALCFVFEPLVTKLRLEKLGLDMTVVAAGACMVIAAATASGWKAPRPLNFMLVYGRRSYEIYLTHMFVVIACFDVFRELGRKLALALPVALVIIVFAALLGEVVARFYSEPVSRALRARFGDAPNQLGSVVAGEASSMEEARHV
jgi:peptidoglycan/LPS O-acetylase OafA/YrhL